MHEIKAEVNAAKNGDVGKVAALRGSSFRTTTPVSTRVGFLQLHTYSLPEGPRSAVPALEVCLLTNGLNYRVSSMQSSWFP